LPFEYEYSNLDSITNLGLLSNHTSLAPPPPPSVSLYHDIPSEISIANPQQLSLSFGTPALSPPSLGQSPQAARLSPRTPEQEISYTVANSGLDIISSSFNPTKNSPKSTEYDEPICRSLSSDRLFDSQGDPVPESSGIGAQYQNSPRDCLNSHLPRSSVHKSSEASRSDQVSPGPISPRKRRKHIQQLTCSSCSKAFSRRCDLKYVPTFLNL